VTAYVAKQYLAALVKESGKSIDSKEGAQRGKNWQASSDNKDPPQLAKRVPTLEQMLHHRRGRATKKKESELTPATNHPMPRKHDPST
jgi:hypothetical protein